MNCILLPVFNAGCTTSGLKIYNHAHWASRKVSSDSTSHQTKQIPSSKATWQCHQTTSFAFIVLIQRPLLIDYIHCALQGNYLKMHKLMGGWTQQDVNMWQPDDPHEWKTQSVSFLTDMKSIRSSQSGWVRLPSTENWSADLNKRLLFE